jgi:hypothetical protein
MASRPMTRHAVIGVVRKLDGQLIVDPLALVSTSSAPTVEVEALNTQSDDRSPNEHRTAV